MIKAEGMNPVEYLDSIGLRRLNDSELQSIAGHYQNDLLAGVRGEGSSLAMFQSCLSPVDFSTLPQRAEAVVFEVGGTYMYGAGVRLEEGELSITTSHKKPWKKIAYESPEEFYGTVIDEMEPVLEGSDPDAISIVYSFRGEPRKTEEGVDVLSVEELTKEFKIPGISRRGVGVSFIEALHARYPSIPTNVRRVVLNDTVATSLARGAKMGGVVGSGFNLAMDTPEGIVNTESGSFALKQSHDVARELDNKSLYPGQGLAEKQISGSYLGEQLRMIVNALKGKGLQLPFLGEDVTSETITSTLLNQEEGQEVMLVKVICARLRDRSAQIVGTMIGTAIETFPEVYGTEGVERIPIEGSLFWGMPGYHERVLNEAMRFSPKQIEFLNIPDAGRIGAAVAALSFVR